MRDYNELIFQATKIRVWLMKAIAIEARNEKFLNHVETFHVNMSDEYMREKSRRERRNISSFILRDDIDCRKVIPLLVEEILLDSVNYEDVAMWLADRNDHKDLIIRQTMGAVLGCVYSYSQKIYTPKMNVVLKRTDSGYGFYIASAYPVR